MSDQKPQDEATAVTTAQQLISEQVDRARNDRDAAPESSTLYYDGIVGGLLEALGIIDALAAALATKP